MVETHDLYLTVSEIEDIYGAAMPRYHAEYARLQNAIPLLHEAGLLAQDVAAEELKEKIAAFLEPNRP